MVLVLYFSAKKKPILPLLIPMLFIMGITVVAMIGKLRQFLASENWLMLGLAAALLALQLWMVLEGIAAVRRRRQASP
jgi:carbon starvation protein